MVLSKEYPPISRAFVRDAGNCGSVMKDDGVGGTFAMVWRVPVYNFRNGEFCARKSIGSSRLIDNIIVHMSRVDW